MKVLVTGAGGFVGKRLVRSLLDGGHQVIGVSRKRPATWIGDYLEVDLSEAPDLSAALVGVDAVVHLASRVHQGNETSADLIPVYRKQVTEATLHLARTAKAAGVKRFVYMSSVKAVPEISGEMDPYGRSKHEAEDGLREMSDSNFRVAILRPPLVYGPGVKANFLQLMKFVDRGVPLPLASVKNHRSLVFVGNLVSAIQACLTSTEIASTPYFVSDKEVVSTADLIRGIAKAMGRNPRLLSFPPKLLRAIGSMTGQSGKIQRLTEDLVVDSSDFRRALRWEPPFSSEAGIRETVEWYMSRGPA